MFIDDWEGDEETIQNIISEGNLLASCIKPSRHINNMKFGFHNVQQKSGQDINKIASTIGAYHVFGAAELKLNSKSYIDRAMKDFELVGLQKGLVHFFVKRDIKFAIIAEETYAVSISQLNKFHQEVCVLTAYWAPTSSLEPPPEHAGRN